MIKKLIIVVLSIVLFESSFAQIYNRSKSFKEIGLYRNLYEAPEFGLFFTKSLRPNLVGQLLLEKSNTIKMLMNEEGNQRRVLISAGLSIYSNHLLIKSKLTKKGNCLHLTGRFVTGINLGKVVKRDYKVLSLVEINAGIQLQFSKSGFSKRSTTNAIAISLLPYLRTCFTNSELPYLYGFRTIICLRKYKVVQWSKSI